MLGGVRGNLWEFEGKGECARKPNLNNCYGSGFHSAKGKIRIDHVRKLQAGLVIERDVNVVALLPEQLIAHPSPSYPHDGLLLEVLRALDQQLEELLLLLRKNNRVVYLHDGDSPSISCASEQGNGANGAASVDA